MISNLLTSLFESAYLCRVAPAVYETGFTPAISECVTFIPGGRTRVPTDEPVNAVLGGEIEKPVGTVTHWSFEFSEGEVSGAVGFTTQELFGEGWSMRSILQQPCGNLSGVGALLIGWTKAFKNPSVVDWYIERPDENSITIYSVVNGENQPTAAKINFKDPNTIKKILPAVSFKVSDSQIPGNSKCTFKLYPQALIDQSGGQMYKTPKAIKGVVDTWLFDGSDFNGAKLIVEEEGGVVIRVSNTLKPTITLNDINKNHGAVQFDPNGTCISTRKMPLGDRARVENLISQTWIKNPGATWKLDGDRLVIGSTSFTRQPALEAFIISAEEQGIEKS